jgi:hypothetical protein
MSNDDPLLNSETALIALDILVEQVGAHKAAELYRKSLGGSLSPLARTLLQEIYTRANTKSLDLDNQEKVLAWLTKWLEEVHSSRS